MSSNGREMRHRKGKRDEEGGGREVLEEGLFFPETSGYHN